MNPTSLLLDCITRTILSIEIHAAHVSVARAQGDVVAQISDASGQFEFEQRYPHCAEASTAPASSSSVIGKGQHDDDPLARGVRLVANHVVGAAEFAGARSTFACSSGCSLVAPSSWRNS